MSVSLEQQLNRIAGVGPQPSSGFGGLPAGFEGGSMSAANDALGVQLAATRHDHSVSIHSGLLKVQNDTMRRILENF